VMAAQKDGKLPEPFATPSAKNTPTVIARPVTGHFRQVSKVDEHFDGIERLATWPLGQVKSF
jgi:hypothetical protein